MQMQWIIILQLAELISFHQNTSFVKGVLITHGYCALNSIQLVWICTANFTPSRPLLTGRCRCTCLDADCSLRFWNEDILLSKFISSHTLLSISSTCGRPKNWLREVVGRMELASSRGKRSESRGMSWCRVQMSSRGWVKIDSHDIDSLRLSIYLDFLGNPHTAQYIMKLMPDLTHTDMYIYICVCMCSRYAVSDSLSWIFLIIMNYLAVSWTS